MYDNYQGNNNKSQAVYMQWWLYPIVGIICITFLFIGVAIGKRSVQQSEQTVQQETQNNQQAAENNEAAAEPTQEQAAVQSQEDGFYSIGDTVVFDELELTFNEVSVQPVDNQFASFTEAVLISVSVKNISSETKGFNFLYSKMFGPQGTEVDSASTYFDDSIEWAGEMRSGASMYGSLAFKYDNDGEYILELDNWTENIEVKFDVVK